MKYYANKTLLFFHIIAKLQNVNILNIDAKCLNWDDRILPFLPD